MKKATLLKNLPCRNCIHRIDDETCKAYPDGIPEVYNYGGNIHTVKEPDQVGDYLLETTEEYKRKSAERMAEADRKGQERRAIARKKREETEEHDRGK